MSMAQGNAAAAIAAASPSRGRSIAGAVAPLIGHMHAAVASSARVAAKFGFKPAWLNDCSRDEIQFADDEDRLGWALVAVALVESIQSGAQPKIGRALDWFGGGHPAGDFPESEFAEAEAALLPVFKAPDVGALLPYLLDTYGRTTRLDVMRDASLMGKRSARKEAGSFYTPADVAFFMASAIADTEEARWFDPACGSGIFLIAALRAMRAKGLNDLTRFATSRLFGTDISAQACDFAAFAILHEVGAELRGSPHLAWAAMRHNIVAADALKNTSAPPWERDVGLADAKRPLRLLCNPPYSTAGGAAATVDGLPTRSLYLPFVEKAWTVASGSLDAAAIVVPLALGANTAADHKRCRSALSRAGGDWTMLFFDRQPHAIFGEEAKTRATIAIRRPGPAPATISTSGLLKWTSRQRNEILTEARAVSLGQERITRIIPKLGSREEVDFYKRLTGYRLKSSNRPRVSKAVAGEIVGTSLSDDVFIAGTAYNFLNVFRNYPDHLSWRGQLSSSGIHKLRFADPTAADIATALLASRTAFWLWHAECDGFHVPAWFLAELPLLDLNFPSEARHALAHTGREIWRSLQRDIVVSNNRDRLTFAFRPTHISQQRDIADEIILRELGFEDPQLAFLHDFEFRVVSIDGSTRAAKSSPAAHIAQREELHASHV